MCLFGFAIRVLLRRVKKYQPAQHYTDHARGAFRHLPPPGSSPMSDLYKSACIYHCTHSSAFLFFSPISLCLMRNGRGSLFLACSKVLNGWWQLLKFFLREFVDRDTHSCAKLSDSFHQRHEESPAVYGLACPFSLLLATSFAPEGHGTWKAVQPSRACLALERKLAYPGLKSEVGELEAVVAPVLPGGGAAWRDVDEGRAREEGEPGLRVWHCGKAGGLFSKVQ